MGFLVAFAFVAILLAYIGIIVWLVLQSVDGDWGPWGAIAGILLFAIGFALILSSAGDDEHANQTCLRGHEEWRITPKGQRYKAWVCELWEER